MTPDLAKLKALAEKATPGQAADEASRLIFLKYGKKLKQAIIAAIQDGQHDQKQKCKNSKTSSRTHPR